jgi:hypothetical protein
MALWIVRSSIQYDSRKGSVKDAVLAAANDTLEHRALRACLDGLLGNSRGVVEFVALGASRFNKAQQRSTVGPQRIQQQTLALYRI